MEATTQLGVSWAVPSSITAANAGGLLASAPFRSFAATAAGRPTAAYGGAWLGPSATMPVFTTPAHEAFSLPEAPVDYQPCRTASQVPGVWGHSQRCDASQASARLVSDCKAWMSMEENHASCFNILDTASCGKFHDFACDSEAAAGWECDTANSLPPAAPNCEPSSLLMPPAGVKLEGAFWEAACGVRPGEVEGQCRQWAPEEAAGEAGEAAVKCEVEMEEEAEEGAVEAVGVPASLASSTQAGVAAAAAVRAPKRRRRNNTAAAAGCRPVPARARKRSSGVKKHAPAKLTKPASQGTAKSGGRDGKKTKASGSSKIPSFCMCGQPLYNGKRVRGRTPANSNDARLLPEHTVDLAFLQLHFVDNRMTFRAAYRYHPHSFATYSRRMGEEKLIHLPAAEQEEQTAPRAKQGKQAKRQRRP